MSLFDEEFNTLAINSFLYNIEPSRDEIIAAYIDRDNILKVKYGENNSQWDVRRINEHLTKLFGNKNDAIREYVSRVVLTCVQKELKNDLTDNLDLITGSFTYSIDFREEFQEFMHKMNVKEERHDQLAKYCLETVADFYQQLTFEELEFLGW